MWGTELYIAISSLIPNVKIQNAILNVVGEVITILKEIALGDHIS